jgi:uncharacterized membrane protein
MRRMALRKVNAYIPDTLHSQATALAHKHRSTIAAIASYGLRLAIDELRSNPEAGAQLTKDPRLKKEET